MTQRTLDLPAGRIHYREVGPADGRPVVFVHGFLVDGTLWADVPDRLAERGLRCLVPTWPLGAHPEAMRAGADLSPRAEEGALAGEIARCISDMTALTVPSVSVLLGEGTGGGALALLPARRVVAAGNAWLSPLPPEGASAIVFKDTEHAPLLAARQRVGAPQMHEDGLVDVLVPEEPAAHVDPQAFARAIGAAVAAQVEAQL